MIPPPLEISRNTLNSIQKFDELNAAKIRFVSSLMNHTMLGREKKFDDFVRHEIQNYVSTVHGNLEDFKDVFTISLFSTRDAAIRQQEPPPLPS